MSIEGKLSSIFIQNKIQVENNKIKSYCLHILFHDLLKCGKDLMRNN